MTIEEHFQQVFRRIKYCAVAAGILVACLLTWRYPHLTRLQSAGVGLLLGIPFAIVLFLLLRKRFLCPRCGTDLGKLRQQEVRRERRARGWFNVETRQPWDVWQACPHCGVSFKEPYPLT